MDAYLIAVPLLALAFGIVSVAAIFIQKRWFAKRRAARLRSISRKNA